MKKLDSFSLVEVMVVLVLSTILTTLAYRGYEIFEIYYQTYKKNTFKSEDINRLQTLLQEWTLTSNKITKEQETIVFHFDNTQHIFYPQHQFVVCEVYGKQDTLQCIIDNLQVFWKEEEQMINNELIDEIYFDIIHTKKYSCTFLKRYDMATYFEQEEK